MNMQRGGLLAALGIAAVAAACASTGTGGAVATAPTGGVSGARSLPQVTCAAGPPAATLQAAAAQAALNRTMLPLSAADKQAAYTTALQQAEAGTAADANNPYHYFLAGEAHAGLGHPAEAARAFSRTLELCPGFASDVSDARSAAAEAAFEAGLAAYQAGDTATALAQWSAVPQLDSVRTDAWFNQGVVYMQRGDMVRAVENYRRVLAAPVVAGDTSAANRRGTALTALVSAGASLFQQDKFREAHDVFSQLRTMDPNNRDAVYNDALALYKMERWADLAPVAARLTQMDPLNYNAQIILFNAYKGLSEAAKARNDAATERTNRDLALRTLTLSDSLPVQVSDVSVAQTATGITISGTVTGQSARAGTPIQLEFTATNAQGPVGTATVTVAAPAKDQTAKFEVAITTTAPATSWRYRRM